MTTGALGRIVVVSLPSGSELIEQIKITAKKAGIEAAIIHCIGSVSQISLGYYRGKDEGYLAREFNEHLELVSCTGSLSTGDNGEKLVHIHSVVSDRNFSVYAGHLISAKAGYTAELYLMEVAGTDLIKTVDNTVGLQVFKQEAEVENIEELYE